MTTETTPATEPAAAPAETTAAATTPAPETTAAAVTDAPKKATEAEIIEGFNKAIAEDPEAAPPKKDEAAPVVDAAAKDDKKIVEPVVAKEKTDAEKAAEATETEIKSLGLKDKTAERFRELSKRPTPEAVEKQLAPLRERAEKADAWERILVDSTAKPEQLSSALGYLQAINSGDPVSMGKAYDVMVQEVAWLGKQLGREVPGAYDPLKDHPDLAAKVDGGDMSREIALDMVRLRAEASRTTDLNKRRDDEARRTNEQKAATDRGVADLSALGRRLHADDAADYAKKVALLKPEFEYAYANLTPDKWVAHIEREYRKIKLAAAPAPVATVGHVPLRPTGSSGAQVPVPKSPLEALRLGVASA